MAFSWTLLPVGDEKVAITQLNEVYTKINTARTASGISGSVSSGKSGTDDEITGEDINKVRAEIDIVEEGYNTGCSSHNTYVNLAIDVTALSTHNTTQCGTVNATYRASHNTTHNNTVNSSNNSAVY